MRSCGIYLAEQSDVSLSGHLGRRPQPGESRPDNQDIMFKNHAISLKIYVSRPGSGSSSPLFLKVQPWNIQIPPASRNWIQAFAGMTGGDWEIPPF
jgi:hypothetical protein